MPMPYDEIDRQKREHDEGVTMPTDCPCGDVQFIRVMVPDGMTAADVQHRLATWQGLRDAVDRAVALVGEDTIWCRQSDRPEVLEWLEQCQAALAAADGREQQCPP